MTVADYTKYYFGQRVIVDGKDIATVIRPPIKERPIESENRVWVKFFNGIEQWRSAENVRPLPNGEL